jgi:CheY-like chemotaxis protein
MSIAVALLVSDDPVNIHQFSHALKELSISPDVCQETPTAVRLLNCRKFDAVIVDFQLGEQSGVILDAVRLSPLNRTAVTFAISGSDTETTAVFRERSGFLFERPFSAQSIRSTLKPAYGLILRERRRYFRFPLAIPVTILRQSKPEVRCYSVNISEGGMAVSTFVPLSAGEEVQVQFTLPDHKVPFLAESKIRWWKTGHLIESHCFIDAHLSPEQAFDFVFCEGAELTCVRLKPNVLLSVRASHPVGIPVVELSCRFVRICRISVGCEDCLFLRSSYASRAVLVRDAGERRVHLAGCERRIRHRAEAAALVDLDFRTVLRQS